MSDSKYLCGKCGDCHRSVSHDGATCDHCAGALPALAPVRLVRFRDTDPSCPTCGDVTPVRGQPCDLCLAEAPKATAPRSAVSWLLDPATLASQHGPRPACGLGASLFELGNDVNRALNA